MVSFSGIYAQETEIVKPTICILGGTPSSAKIISEIPYGLKAMYNFISFNRPGFGGTPNEAWDKESLFKLASEAGLKKGDFGIIGISGGGPLAILIAEKFNIKHCGVISGMVPAREYFVYADSTFTKPLMNSVMSGYEDFKKSVESFPNVEEILKQADSPMPIAIQACYDDLHFILKDLHYPKSIYKYRELTWLHGENDKNVALESAQLFLSRFKKAELIIIPEASHAIDARALVKQVVDKWTASQ